MRRISRHCGAAVVVSVLVLALAGCAGVEAAPAPAPESSAPTPAPTVEPVVGQSALPLGCADLLTEAQVRTVVPEWVNTVDEAHISQSLSSVADLQSGELRCGWGDSGWPGTGWSDAIQLAVAPDTATQLDLRARSDSEPDLEALPGDPNTGIGDCSYGSGYGHCFVAQLRSGYRVDLDVWARLSSDAEIRDRALALLDGIGAAIDTAGPQRIVEAPPGSSEPAALCDDPAVRTLVDVRGATGAPTVSTDASRPLAVITTCRWEVPDSSSLPQGRITVEVLSGGAWAVPQLAHGVPYIMLGYRPSADGSYLVGGGDDVSALRALGDDLVVVWAPSSPDDPSVWEQQLAEVW